MLPCHSLLQDIDRRITELHLSPALQAYEMIVMLAAPDMLVPGAPCTGVFLGACPADYSRLHEQRQVPVDGDQREVVSLFFEELQQMVRLKMPLHIANGFQ